MRRTLFAASLAALTAVSAPLADAQHEMPPAPVVVASVVSRSVASTRMFIGTVRPLKESTVGGQVEGPVVELLAREGDRVEKDQPLAKLRTRALELRIAAAKGLLDSRRHELEELENGSRQEDVDQARARVRAASADVDYTKWQLESSRKLFASKQAPEEQFRAAGSAAESAEGRLTEARSGLELLRKGPRPERIARARATLRAQEAAVGLLEDELERHTVRAPFAGYVVAEHTEVGEWLRQGDPVMDVAALDQVDVVVSVLEDFVPELTLGASARVLVSALAGGPLEGRVAVIVPSADPRTRTFPVKVRVENRRSAGGPALRAGMSATVALEIGKPTPSLLVHKDALVLGGRTPVVYVVDPAQADASLGSVRPLAVELGAAVEDLIVVRGDLRAGALVVVRGNERLRPGQAVTYTFGDAAPPARGE